MKKYLPFVFPVVAFLIVLFLASRWYGMRNQIETGQMSPFAEGVEIENLSQNELTEVLRGVGDYKTVDMMSSDDESMGAIRYEIVDDKVKLSVMAGLPVLENETYQVWLREVEGQAIRKAFLLDFSKGGHWGSAAISTEALPFEVVVSRETQPADDQLETVLLQGVVSQEE